MSPNELLNQTQSHIQADLGESWVGFQTITMM